MSVIGNYEFDVFISVADDEFLLNDTLNTTRSHLASFDLATLTAVDVENGCDENVDLRAEFQNLGVEDITSFTATVSVNGNLEQSIDNMEIITSGNSVFIEFLDVPISPGANTILFHKFHFFIYLCTVEIAPVFILLKSLSIF